MSARLLLALFLLLLADPASADHKQDYLNGIDAAKQGDWAKTRRLMLAAIAEEGTPTRRKRLVGTIMSPYVPHYYLGLANAGLGDCSAAISAFETPANAAVVAEISDLAGKQRAAIGKCQQQMLAANTPRQSIPDAPADPKPPVSTAAVSTAPIADARPPVVSTAAVTPLVKPVAAPVFALPSARLAPVNAALARAQTQITALDARLRAPPMAGSTDAKGKSRVLDGLRQQRRQTASELAAVQTLVDLTRIEGQARKLESELATLGERIDSASQGLALDARRALQARATTALAKLDQTLAAASSAGLAATASTAATATRGELEKAVTATDAKLIERALAAAASATTQLNNAIAAAPKPAPEQLRVLVGWYLAADYARAEQWDDLDALPDNKARAQALLVRAAARLHLYVRGGEQASSLNTAIDTDLRKAKRLDQSLKPNTQVFSPRLRERFAAL